MRTTARLRSRWLAAALLWSAVQGWVVAPLADAALRHDPAAAADCPAQGHLERSTSLHGETGCLIRLAHVPSVTPAAPAPVLHRGVLGSLHLGPLPQLPPRAPAALLPPSRAPPSRA